MHLGKGHNCAARENECHISSQTEQRVELLGLIDRRDLVCCATHHRPTSLGDILGNIYIWTARLAFRLMMALRIQR